ncbi:hypothetical protein HNP82_001735 [Catenibacillus scindens]|uniref:Uncharacterized protein n=1 Tax=Catenibacillus scindens TaxID=673271 RepID=A0A7W8M4W8_9FIRM|nr:hypothetical protein [Catenibacillus scindens]MBB5264608.1 hypothetical protein [Catenibacillus scindens]
MINPKRLMEMKRLRDEFTQRHPKFSMFLEAASKEGISEGSVIEISVTGPDGRRMCSNIRVSAEDLELLDTLKQLR